MKEPEQIELLRIIKRVYASFKRQDIKELRVISDSLIEDSTFFQNDYAISLAVIVYSLSKILEKEKYESYVGWNLFYRNVLVNLKKMSFYLEKSKFNVVNETLKTMISQIKNLDKKVSLYIEELLSSAKIKKGSKLYSLGFSLGRASEILGTSKWELMNYIGNLNISNENLKTISVKERYYIAKEVFNLR